jgi:zinc-binding alcohol dehydrogenase/oxidoreductase
MSASAKRRSRAAGIGEPPREMRALVYRGGGFAGLGVEALPIPHPKRGECLVRLEAAALNHRDLWILKAAGSRQAGVILGSDGAGRIAAAGPGVRGFRAGQRVLINPGLGWPAGADAPPAGFQILGDPRHGTFAEYIAIPAANLAPAPRHLEAGEAAALPLSGLTAYRALVSKGGVGKGSRVAIPGIGGGTALMALLLGRALGAELFATSSDPAKRRRALAAGARGAFDTAGPWADAVRRATGGRGVDVVIESVGRASWQESLKALAPGGRLVVYGSTSGDVVETDLVPLFLGWRAILGTTMGNAVEFRAMLRLVAAKRLRPIVDRRFPLARAVEALGYLRTGRQFGKVVLEIAPSET